MIDLEWWQVVIGILAGLGFSAAPWIAALLAGKLITIGVYREMVAAKDKLYNDMLAEKNSQVDRANTDRDSERQGKDVERQRGDGAFRETIALAREFGATTVHLLRALPNVEDEDGDNATS